MLPVRYEQNFYKLFRRTLDFKVLIVSGSRLVFHNRIKRTAFEDYCCVHFLVYLMRLVKSVR